MAYGNWVEGQFRSVDNEVQTYRSIKNKFTNRAVWTFIPGQSASCIPAGQQRPAALPPFTWFVVGAAGSTC
jgi:hypothetical protein